MFGSVNLKKAWNDRFIPLRMDVNVDFSNKEVSSPPSVVKDGELYINYAKIRYHRQNYQNALRRVLFPLDTKVLNFFPPKKFHPNENSASFNQLWPVRARKKPEIGPPEMILDMPQFDSHICHHVADWSSKNCLATIFENEIHMWHPNEEFVRETTKTQKRVQNCVKWRSDGMKLAVGLRPSKVGLWDVTVEKIICETSCCTMLCEVFSLEWINNTYLLTGCSYGILTLYNAKMKCLKRQRIPNNGGIVNIVGSSSKKLIAVSCLNKNVTVWKVPEMECHLQIRCNSIVRALAWHPWKTSILAMGLGSDSEDCRVALWNVNTQSMLAHEKSAYKNSSIDALAFNPISGELVVSYFVRRERNRSRGIGIIAVLSNMDTVVEELHIHDGPVRYLLWGSEGKLLASASADENLCIWKFFGSQYKEVSNNVIDKQRRSSSVLFRYCIR